MKVSELMSTRLVTVEADDSLSTVRHILERTQFHHMLVMDNGQLVGVITDRELYHFISPYLGTMIETDRDKAALQKRAHQIMQRNPSTLPPDADLSAALAVLSENPGHTCIVIMGNGEEPTGIITWRDLLRLLDNLYRNSQSEKET
jgi:acetoin utilization protein AcuB